MAIRFQCGGCNQPIEVDDEWGGRVVACPYCRRVASAPSVSTLDPGDAIPVASPIGMAPTAGSTVPPAIPGMSRASAMVAPPGNAFAVTAFALSLLLVAVMLAFIALLAAHRDEYAAFQRQVQEAARSGQSMFDAAMKIGQSNAGAMPGWLMLAGFLELAAIANWVTSVVLAIIGLRRTHRRGLAVAALLICLAVLLSACVMSGVLAIGGASSAPAFIV